MTAGDNPFEPPQQIINYLPEDVDYRVEETAFGTWRSFMYENGKTYHEFISHAEVAGMPLFHYTAGKCPENGRSKTACGVVAVGRFASGFVAIGQVAWGVVAIGQASFGVLISLGQLAIGLSAVGQAAIGVFYAFGQFAVGYYAIGMFALGYYAKGLFAAGVIPMGKKVFKIPAWW